MHIAPTWHHSHMHTVCTKPTWKAVQLPGLGKGGTPCTMFLSYTGCLCFSIFATRHWDHGALSSIETGATQASLPPHAPAAQQVALPQSCPPVTSFNHSASMVTAAEPADPMPTPLLTGMLSHPPIPITDMAEHMERLKANDSLKLSQEYEVS